MLKPEDVFVTYQRALAEYQHRGWRYPTNWEKIKARPDWKYFDQFTQRVNSQTTAIDVEGFFKANFKARRGAFQPAKFLHRQSIRYYAEWLRTPAAESEVEQLKRSILWLAKHLRETGKTFDQYFDYRTSVFPPSLLHFMQRKVHRWLLAYNRYLDSNWLRDAPPDVVGHVFEADDVDALHEKIDVWVLQLASEQEAIKLIKQFRRMANGQPS